MELKNLILTYLATTLGKSSEDITAILFKAADDGTLTEEISDTALDSLEAAHAEHLQEAPTDLLKAEYNKGHQAGKFEALSKEEEAVRKAYGLEGKGKLPTLIAEAISKATKDGATEDKILTHPIYVKAKTEHEEALEALKADHEAKIAGVTTQAGKAARFNQVAPTIDQALLAAGVSADFLKPAAKRAFMAQFEGKDFEILETGIFIKGADGILEKDRHQNPIKLEAFVSKSASEWFPIVKQEDRKTAGNEGGDPPPQTKWTKDNLPKTAQDFQTAYYATTDPAERTQLAKAYQEHSAG